MAYFILVFAGTYVTYELVARFKKSVEIGGLGEVQILQSGLFPPSQLADKLPENQVKNRILQPWLVEDRW
jgi:hypothetical protein